MREGKAPPLQGGAKVCVLQPAPHLAILRNEVTKNLKTFNNTKAGGQAPSGFYDLKTKIEN